MISKPMQKNSVYRTLSVSPLMGKVIVLPRAVIVNIPCPSARALSASLIQNLRGTEIIGITFHLPLLFNERN